MTSDETQDAIETLVRYLNRTLSAEALQQYTSAFHSADRNAFALALRDWMRSHSPSTPMPSIADLRASIRAHTMPANNTKRESWSFAVLGERTSSTYGKAVCRLMSDVLAMSDARRQAQAYRAFAAEHNEREPWETLALRAKGRVGIKPPMQLTLPAPIPDEPDTDDDNECDLIP